MKIYLLSKIYKAKLFFRRNINKLFWRNKMGITIDLKGKKAIVFGIANDKSIAWHIAKRLDEAGCRIMAAYQERHQQTALHLIKNLRHNPVFEKCDVTDDNLFEEFFKKAENEFGKFDFIVHSIAFAKKEHLTGRFIDVDKE